MMTIGTAHLGAEMTEKDVKADGFPHRPALRRPEDRHYRALKSFGAAVISKPLADQAS
jgi:hypothetical protein